MPPATAPRPDVAGVRDWADDPLEAARRHRGTTTDATDALLQRLHDGLGGADDFYWPGGSATIVGGDTGEAYDTNVYGTKTGGDRLHIEGDGPVVGEGEVIVDMGPGIARRVRIERIHLGGGADIVRGGAAAIDRYGLSIWTGAGDDQINEQLTRFAEELRTHPDVAQYFYVAGAEDFVIHFRGRDSADLRSFVTDHLSTHSIVAATNTSLIFERTDGLRGV